MRAHPSASSTAAPKTEVYMNVCEGANPFHLACVALAHSKYAEVCPTCDRKTVEAWRRANGGTAAPSEIIDLRGLESEGEGAVEVACSDRE